MESLLERGEKLDDLVSKSEVLGVQSKAFYKTVRTPPSPLPMSSGVTAPLLRARRTVSLRGAFSYCGGRRQLHRPSQ